MYNFIQDVIIAEEFRRYWPNYQSNKMQAYIVMAIILIILIVGVNFILRLKRQGNEKALYHALPDDICKTSQFEISEGSRACLALEAEVLPF
jgi:hypothetical protein